MTKAWPIAQQKIDLATVEYGALPDAALELVTGGLLPQIAPIAILIGMVGDTGSSASGTAGGAVTSAGGTANVRS